MALEKEIIAELKQNLTVFRGLLENLPEEMVRWKDHPLRWSLLEIVCHLYDEEKEDFRARTRSVLLDPNKPLTPFDPQEWVVSRAYAEQDYELMLFKFVKQRKISIEWLESLKDPAWDNSYAHPSLGNLSARLFLSNWLAHDHLHFRQIIKTKYDYLKENLEDDLSYAGNW